MTVYLLWSTLHRFGEKEILHAIYADEQEARKEARERQNAVSVECEEFHVQPYHVTVKKKQKKSPVS